MASSVLATRSQQNISTSVPEQHGAQIDSALCRPATNFGDLGFTSAEVEAELVPYTVTEKV